MINGSVLTKLYSQVVSELTLEIYELEKVTEDSTNIMFSLLPPQHWFFFEKENLVFVL